ncbi:hypothetical protein [Enterovibrio norvegicus]|uniref:hypothetical protein n=1 Tax=Enterovibrio norvegicus TaxID=188144 RepID=UPI000C864BF9|nr:hypothetical protein [Enterovibrio norvegicus]MCC4798793.1 hypothetical protein [Enterovibrio norvegicus]PMI33414.1 hypothetical protein BCU47_09955 [Enterovibrio norvegicus]PMI33738.1 hypothetical protein BCU46_21945 [Enterovibrio norvegicus]PMN52190.1 hypothetical protein BCT30_13235 [Enterovibrio norvegicus]PMN69128.1 hypothetical protein BCT27_04095 [Enterovibrio norvegicus]
MKLKLLLSVFFSISLAGCSSSIPMNAVPHVESYQVPKQGTQVQSYVGEYMINQGVRATSPYLVVEHLMDGVSYNIGAGDYPLLGTEKNGRQYFSIYSQNGGYVQPGVFVDPPFALSPDEKKGLCVSTVFVKNASCYEQGIYAVKNKTVESNGSFQQRLIYNGSFGDKINISYREFSDSQARDAFTNNVEYDMSKSRVINYKGAQIEVIDFDNSSITYKVLKHFR